MRDGRMMLVVRRFAAGFVAALIGFLARLITAVRGVRHSDEAYTEPCVFYANHASHGDFVLIWTVLPPGLRAATRPVAGADYWQASRLRRFIGVDAFRSLLIARNGERADIDPITAMTEALDQGSSLIVFPEGTRNTTEDRLLPLKSGIFHLAEARPDVDFVPVWISNLNRVLPKGEFLPVPLLCIVRFGAALRLDPGESKAAFLERARDRLLTLADEDEPVRRRETEQP